MSLSTAMLLLTPLLPFLLALAVAIRPGQEVVMRLLPVAAVPALLAAILPAGEPVVLDWLLLGTQLHVDSLGRTFLLFTGGLWLIAGWYAGTYISAPERRRSYALFHLLAMTGNLGLIIAQDMASFYCCFALMSFASYGLVIHNRDAEALRAGRVYLILVVIGEVILFAGLQRLAAATGGLDLPGPETPYDTITTLLLFLGFGIKAGVLPLHVWLPLAHPAAPVPASAVLSGTMIKAGLIGWLRFLPLGQADALPWGDGLIAAGLLAAFFGVVVGCCQTNPKAVLAYSSISQMGLMTTAVGLVFATPGPTGPWLGMVALFAAHHALAKGALFLSVGIMAHPPQLPKWLLAGALMLPALALIGAPFTSGALAKGVLKTAAADHSWLKLLLPVAGMGTTVLMWRFLTLGRSLAGPGHDDAHPAKAGMWLPWLFLVVMVLLLPWLPRPLTPAPLPGWWSKIWPLVIGLGLAIAWESRWQRRQRKAPLIPPGDLLHALSPITSWFHRLSTCTSAAGRASVRLRWVIRRGIRAGRFWAPTATGERWGWTLSSGLVLTVILALLWLFRF